MCLSYRKGVCLSRGKAIPKACGFEAATRHRLMIDDPFDLAQDRFTIDDCPIVHLAYVS